MSSIHSLVFLVCLCMPLQQTGRLPTHPRTIQLRDLLVTVKNIRDPRMLTQRMLDSLVSAVRWGEHPKMDSSSYHYETFLGNDANQELFYPAFDKIVEGAKRSRIHQLAILRLASIITSNAELAESMPIFVQEAARANTRLFLEAFLTLSKKEQDQTITGALGWPSEIDIRQLFMNFAQRTNSAELRRMALRIAREVDHEMTPAAAP